MKLSSPREAPLDDALEAPQKSGCKGCCRKLKEAQTSKPRFAQKIFKTRWSEFTRPRI